MVHWILSLKKMDNWLKFMGWDIILKQKKMNYGKLLIFRKKKLMADCFHVKGKLIGNIVKVIFAIMILKLQNKKSKSKKHMKNESIKAY